jgi:predicted TIM-barrel fold metal-dependent hydrolase
VADASDRTAFPIAIVAYADMLADDARPATRPAGPQRRVRGVRMQLHWHENPLYRFAASPDLARDERLQANVARLAQYGWSFDLQVFRVADGGRRRTRRACPDVTFVLQHAGMLEDLSDEGWMSWRAACGCSRRGRTW